jgi:hypothetical protein
MVLQGYFVVILLNAVQIRRDHKNGIQHTEIQYIQDTKLRKLCTGHGMNQDERGMYC